VNRISF